jgi:hypothetical protein
MDRDTSILRRCVDMRMKRKVTLGIVASLVLLLIVAVWMLISKEGVGSISEFDDVFRSPPERWEEFYDARAPARLGWVHLPEEHDGHTYRSTAKPDLQGFVPPKVCGECHAEKLQAVLETAHYRTSSLATRETVLGEFGAAGRVKTRHPDLHFEMVEAEDGLFQRAVIRKDGRTYDHAERFDLVIGSGNHGQTYLYWHGDKLFQLPISFFSESGGWINSPGIYRDGTADFARGIGHRCLDCHATFFAPAPGTEVRYDPEQFVLGVTCVRCHGHGWAHVQYHRTHASDKAPRYIVQPGALPRDRANEVCAQCHSGVGQLLRPAFTYQPGDPLAEYLRLGEPMDDPKNDDPHAANQLARLMKSRCFQESDNLTCATCHDPHRHERGKLKLFAERCAKCHESSDCRLPGATPEQIRDHCVQCHMPSRRDLEGAMETAEGKLLPLLRDHYIKVWPDLPNQHEDERPAGKD